MSLGRILGGVSDPPPARSVVPSAPERILAGASQVVFAIVSSGIFIFYWLISGYIGTMGCSEPPYATWIAGIRQNMLPFLVGFSIIVCAYVPILLRSKNRPRSAYWMSYSLAFPLWVLAAFFLVTSQTMNNNSCWYLVSADADALALATIIAFLAAASTTWTAFRGIPVKKDEKGQLAGVLWR
jgi:hypothetical protein